jgi:hypothetical protein
MSAPGRAARRACTLGLLVSCLVAPATALAEIGVTIGPTPGAPKLPYELQSIIEDPEPFGIVWLRFNADGPGRAVLNDQGYPNGDGPPSILLHPGSGLPVVAWAQNSAGGFDVVVSTFQNGAWTLPQVLAGGFEDELDPNLVIDPATGDVHLFYWIDEAQPRVMHRQAPADLSSWSPPLQVSQPNEAACRPAGVFHGGNLYVAYEDHNFGAGQAPRNVVLAQKVGGSFTPQIVAVTSHDGPNRPQIHSHDGRFWLDWIDDTDRGAWTGMSSQGAWEPIQHEPFSGAEERDFHLRGAIRMRVIEEGEPYTP